MASNLFYEAVTAAVADAAIWYGLSLAQRALGAAALEDAALDQVLRLDGQHLPAMLAKGDLLVKRGDRRAAMAYYAAGIKLAARMPSLPAEWRADVRRVEVTVRSFEREYEAHLLAALGDAGLGEPGTGRFSHALDLLLGKRQLYPQQPKYFLFPELPHTQFFDPGSFTWVAPLQRACAAVRAEVAALLDRGAVFQPYIERARDRPPRDTELPENPDWVAFFLIKDGEPVAGNAERCPRTLAALQQVPLCRIRGRTPSVLFSLLRPGARIPPHHGFTNARLICHLPLIVPAQCGLRVGNDTRTWREGEVVIFDDSIEHEAWNSSGEPRVVLIFDVWRPELTDQERRLVARTLEAIQQFDGPRRKWSE